MFFFFILIILATNFKDWVTLAGMVVSPNGCFLFFFYLKPKPHLMEEQEGTNLLVSN